MSDFEPVDIEAASSYRVESMHTRKFVNDPNSPARKRALSLARTAERLHAKLLKARALKGMTQSQVAETLGVTQPTIAAFERYDNDPRLSSILSYAHAVGASISISVAIDGVEVDLGWSTMVEAKVPFSQMASVGTVARPSHASVELRLVPELAA